MNEVHYTIAAAVIIPTKEEREAQRINAHLEKLQKKKEPEVAGLFSKDRDAEIRLVVLQPFVVMGGVFSIHLEAAGNDSRSALCTSLPIVHDAVLTELHNTSEDPVMQPPGQHLKVYADAVWRQINDTFGQTVVSTVILVYADVNTFNANYRRMQTGSSKRCVARKR